MQALNVKESKYLLAEQNKILASWYSYVIYRNEKWETGVVEREEIIDSKTFENFDDAKKYFLDPFLYEIKAKQEAS